MKKITTSITVPANEFNPAPLYHVFDHNDMITQEYKETSRDARESELKHYRDQGYEIVSVEETGRFAARFTITMTKKVPRKYTFKTEREQQAKAKELKAKYK